MTPSEEQLALGSTLRSLLERRWAGPERRTAASADAGTLAPGGALWRELTSTFGLTGLAVPTSFGGAGFSDDDLAIVFEETGRALLGGPFLATTAMALPLLVDLVGGDAFDTDTHDRASVLIGDLAAGEIAASVAFPQDPACDAQPLAIETDHRGQHLVTGQVEALLSAPAAAVVLVPVMVDDDVAVAGIELTPGSAEVTRLDGVDPSRAFGRCRFTRAPAVLWARGPGVRDAVRHARDGAGLALAAEQWGAAQRVLELTVAHVRVREQFGRPLGSFQAVRHQLANVLVELQLARAALLSARAAARRGGDTTVAVSAAQALCSDVLLDAAEKAIHLHGALGFTAEHPVHLYYQRALASRAMLGLPRQHRRRITRHLIEHPESRRST